MSIEKLIDMMNKQKLIDGMIHNQKMNRQEFVESLIQKQHDAELHNFISTKPPLNWAAIWMA
jgi:magnesium transporter